MDAATVDTVAFYAEHGPITSPGEYAGLFEDLPKEIPELCEAMQGLLLHIFWAARHGVELSEERKSEVGLRHVRRMVARMLDIDDRPLAVMRPPGRRLVGNCRDFSVLLCAALRQRGVPARARCGFGTYFTPGKYEDHWVCEYWHARERRWVTVDAQLDNLQQETLRIAFDPLDLPPGRFITGGEGWRMCRAGSADPDDFGIFDMHGLWFVRGDLVRDLAALNRMELLPWDGWGLIEGGDDDLSEGDLALLDRAAALSTDDNVEFADRRALYEGNDNLRVPSVITSYTERGAFAVDLATGESAEVPQAASGGP
jgi:hypothetical protein